MKKNGQSPRELPHIAPLVRDYGGFEGQQTCLSQADAVECGKDGWVSIWVV